MEINDIKVSYTILTHNETESLKKLLQHIQKYKTVWDEIIIVDDYSDNKETLDIIEWAVNELDAKEFVRKLDNDFASQKNFAESKATNEYIFNIDADEIMSDFFMENYKEILYLNLEAEMYRLPRLNTVSGLTLKHIEQWRWQISSIPTFINEKEMYKNSDEYQLLLAYGLIINEVENKVKYLVPLINYPDYQGRIYKKKDSIKWSGKVHELLIGYKKYCNFPMEKNYCIIHDKKIDRQEKQNEFYNNMKR